MAGSIIQASGMVLFQDALKTGALEVDIMSASQLQHTGVILTPNNCHVKNSFRIHFWDANGVFWKEKELAVQ